MAWQVEMVVIEALDDDDVEDPWERVEVEGNPPADSDALLVVCGLDELEVLCCTDDEVDAGRLDDVVA